ncbi:unnamed protein product [Prorocentrum cordatum]|uniref:Secreted protein n=1 Tax=Prorocentrum cordatum TaxID=2364126 RepID=A0ABN9RNY2_9DINO|nr:unnamed protein product [Polarella glacialis]
MGGQRVQQLASCVLYHICVAVFRFHLFQGHGVCSPEEEACSRLAICSRFGPRRARRAERPPPRLRSSLAWPGALVRPGGPISGLCPTYGYAVSQRALKACSGQASCSVCRGATCDPSAGRPI